LRQSFQVGTQIALADNYVKKIGSGLQQIRDDPDHAINALAWFRSDQSAYGQQKAAARKAETAVTFGLRKCGFERGRKDYDVSRSYMLVEDEARLGRGTDGKDASGATQRETLQKRERLPYLHSVGDNPIADAWTKPPQKPSQRRQVYVTQIKAVDLWGRA
jgi:hypothetical protein